MSGNLALWILALYVLIGIFFGELSIGVKRINPGENAPAVVALTYFFAVISWPLILVLSYIQASKGK